MSLVKDSMDLRFNQGGGGGGGGGKGWWVKRKGVGHIVNRLALYMVMMITVGCPVCLLICNGDTAGRVNRQVPFRIDRLRHFRRAFN